MVIVFIVSGTSGQELCQELSSIGFEIECKFVFFKSCCFKSMTVKKLFGLVKISNILK